MATTEKERALRPVEDDGAESPEGVAAADAEALSAEELGRQHEAGADDPERDEEGDGQFTIPGTAAGISLNAGGKRPTVAEAKMRSLSLRIDGQFNDGDRVRLVVDAEVTDVQFPRDQKGVRRRKHVFTPVAVQSVPVTPE